jgi:hypothetical protein
MLLGAAALTTAAASLAQPAFLQGLIIGAATTDTISALTMMVIQMTGTAHRGDGSDGVTVHRRRATSTAPTRVDSDQRGSGWGWATSITC